MSVFITTYGSERELDRSSLWQASDGSRH